MQSDHGLVAQFHSQLQLAITAHLPVIAVTTTEEQRLLDHVRAAAHGRTIYQHTAIGLRPVGTSPGQPADHTVMTLSKLIADITNLVDTSAVVVVNDANLSVDLTRQAVRVLADFMARPWQQSPILLFAGPDLTFPPEVADDVHRLEMPLPDRAELADAFDSVVVAAGLAGRVDAATRDRLVGAALGLTVPQARRTFITAVVDDGHLDSEDIPQVLAAKRQIITATSEAVDIVDSTVSFDHVGGMDALKNWVHARRPAFTWAARAYGIPAPKGLALIGVPGAGKSLAAKAIAAELHSPLVRLDMAALFNRHTGESEARVRAALRLAETISPCVLWVDELDRGLAGTGSGDGTASRVAATVLHWLAEKTEPVFVVATANRVDAIPAELLRRGRFDEIFFVDLPDRAARCEVLAVHLIASGRRPDCIDLQAVAAATDGFVGAEIAQVVGDGLLAAFNDRREPTTTDLLLAADHMVPLSTSASEEFAAMRTHVEQGRVLAAG